MVRWYLARHGRTELNRDNRVQGHSQISLDNRGIREAECLRDRLADETFVAAFSSDLMRAQQTTNIILDNQHISFDSSSDLRELDYGLWNGLKFDEIESKYTDDLSRCMDGDHDFAPSGGESVSHLLARTSLFVEHVKEKGIDGKLLVVCHGGSLRGLLIHLLKLPHEFFWSFQVDQASLSIIDLYPNRAVLTLFNDISHLRSLCNDS